MAKKVKKAKKVEKNPMDIGEIQKRAATITKKPTNDETRIALIDNLIVQTNEMQGKVDKKITALEQRIDRLNALVGTINKAVMAGSSIIAVEERIDRIVAAITQSKNIKGL